MKLIFGINLRITEFFKFKDNRNKRLRDASTIRKPSERLFASCICVLHCSATSLSLVFVFVVAVSSIPYLLYLTPGSNKRRVSTVES